MKICSACQYENDELSTQCHHCGVFLRNPRFNFVNFGYAYLFTSVLGKKITLWGLVKVVFIWFIFIVVGAGIGCLLIPVVMALGRLLGPDFSPNDGTQGVPPWVMAGSILGLLVLVYVCFSVRIYNAYYEFREWLAQKAAPKRK